MTMPYLKAGTTLIYDPEGPHALISYEVEPSYEFDPHFRGPDDIAPWDIYRARCLCGASQWLRVSREAHDDPGSHVRDYITADFLAGWLAHINNQLLASDYETSVRTLWPTPEDRAHALREFIEQGRIRREREERA